MSAPPRTRSCACRRSTSRQAVAITFHKYLGRKHSISETFRNFVAVNKQNLKVYDYDCNKKDNA
jgi:hypothetical protein